VNPIIWNWYFRPPLWYCAEEMWPMADISEIDFKRCAGSMKSKKKRARRETRKPEHECCKTNDTAGDFWNQCLIWCYAVNRHALHYFFCCILQYNMALATSKRRSKYCSALALQWSSAIDACHAHHERRIKHIIWSYLQMTEAKKIFDRESNGTDVEVK